MKAIIAVNFFSYGIKLKYIFCRIYFILVSCVKTICHVNEILCILNVILNFDTDPRKSNKNIELSLFLNK